MKIKYCWLFLLQLAGLYYCQDVEFFNCPTVPRVPDFTYRDLSALGIAILYNSTEDIETFLNNGCDVNYDGVWRSEITTKCANPLFTQLGIPCEKQIIYAGYTPLNLATLHGTKETVQRLLQVPGIDVDAASNYTSNPVFNAAVSGNLDILKLLVDAGANLNIKGGKQGQEITPLMAAVASKSTPTVEYLLRTKRINVNIEDKDGWSALGGASRYGTSDIVRLLIRFGADVDQGQGEAESTPLMLATTDPANIESVKHLIRAKAEVDKENTNGDTPLTIASYYENNEAVQELLKARADVNHQTQSGLSPLTLAASKGNIEVVEQLLKAGADINQQTGNGQTALFIAAQQDQKDLALLLIRKGANVNLLSSKGFSAAYAAVENGDLEILQALAKAGADLDVQGTPGIGGSTGWTPLMLAAATGKVEIVRFLKNQGVDLDKTDTDGDTALDLAEQRFDSEIIKILREK